MRAHNQRILDTKKALIALVDLTVGACDFKISNPNSPPSIGPNATAATVNSATVGLLIALREDIANWVQKSSILGREGYRLDTADPRFISELLLGLAVEEVDGGRLVGDQAGVDAGGAGGDRAEQRVGRRGDDLAELVEQPGLL